jgi:aminoglycoside phosphotransferase family enzyme/predicted kinase
LDGRLGWSTGRDAAGKPVDFVVVMRRFDQQNVLDDIARRDDLSVELLHALAAHIVQFHDKAERVLDRGGATAMAELVRTNLAILRSCRAAGFAAPQLDRIECMLTAELAQTRALLEDRRQAGKVRRCHGDLHLRNICMVDGKPLLFDCIEFSEAIASIDVLYDVAFLLMDLEHRGHRHSANLVLNRYLDLSNEDDGLGAVPLFIALRAMIRAHVVATAAQHGWVTGDAESGFLDARGYLGDAELILTSGSPRLIAIGGLSGTGKSTVAGRMAPDLGRRPGARVLRSDVLRKLIFGTEPESRLPSDAYAPDIGERVYSDLCERAALALRAGYSAVIDAVALRADERRSFAAVAEKCRVPFTGIWLEANPECILERVSLRAGDASDASPTIVRRQLAQDPGVLDWIRIDGSGTADATFAAVQRVIGAAT